MSNIQTNRDLQKLVRATILHMNEPFKSDTIVEQVIPRLEGSAFQDSTDLIQEYVQKCLNTLNEQQKIKCIGNTYYPSNPRTGRFHSKYYELMDIIIRA